MATHTLNILKPSVNNMTTRIFVLAAGLDFEETDVWGNKSTPEFLAKDPADLTPLLEEAGLPKGAIHISGSTISVDLSQRLEEAHHGLGQGFIAAPVLGRPPAAEAGKLFVMAAGEAALPQRAKDPIHVADARLAGLLDR